MTFVSALAALGKGWRALVVGALVGLLVAGAALLLTPDRYTAEAGVYVAGIDGAPVPGADFYTNMVLVEQRVTSYRELMTSGRVLGAAARRTGAPVAPGSVAVSPGKASSVFAVTAIADDPGRATATASAVADGFVEVLGQVDPTGVGVPPAVRASVVDRATTAVATGSPPVSVLLAGVAAGVLAAGAVVLLLAVRRGRGRPEAVSGGADEHGVREATATRETFP